MDLLSKLSPAETLLILKPASTMADLMKFTLMDLLMKEELMVSGYESNELLGKARLGFARIVRGKKFKLNEPKLHEMIFLFPFYKKPESKIVFKHLLQMAMNTAKSESNYKNKLLLDAIDMKPVFKKSLLNKIFGGMILSESGKKCQKDIITYFSFLDKELPAMMKNEKEKAQEILLKIKGNVLLLNSIKFDFIQTIGKEISMIQDELEGGEAGT